MSAQSTAWVRSGYSCPIPTDPADRDQMVRAIERGVHAMVAEHFENTGLAYERITEIAERGVTR